MKEQFHLTETIENYLKQIHFLVVKYDSARISDIAKSAGRSLSTVTGAVQRMANDGLLNYEKYGKITLTPQGQILANTIVTNYTTISQLLTLIGVDTEQANIDACEMEHISEYTVSKITSFVNFIESDPDAIDLLKKYNSL